MGQCFSLHAVIRRAWILHLEELRDKLYSYSILNIWSCIESEERRFGKHSDSGAVRVALGAKKARFVHLRVHKDKAGGVEYCPVESDESHEDLDDDEMSRYKIGDKGSTTLLDVLVMVEMESAK
eukprot:Filipodium_phascolosomae@DN2763_c0_g1_i1.p1